MKYYDDSSGKYKEVVLAEWDLRVMETVRQFYNRHPKIDDMHLYSIVENYYYNEVGVGNNRLWKVIEYFVEIITGQRELLSEEEVQNVTWEGTKKLIFSVTDCSGSMSRMF